MGSDQSGMANPWTLYNAMQRLMFKRRWFPNIAEKIDYVYQQEGNRRVPAIQASPVHSIKFRIPQISSIIRVGITNEVQQMTADQQD